MCINVVHLSAAPAQQVTMCEMTGSQQVRTVYAGASAVLETALVWGYRCLGC